VEQTFENKCNALRAFLSPCSHIFFLRNDALPRKNILIPVFKKKYDDFGFCTLTEQMLVH
jgi:hypothetical protein